MNRKEQAILRILKETEKPLPDAKLRQTRAADQ